MVRIQFFRKIFDNFSNGFNFEGVVHSLVVSVPAKFEVGTKKFIVQDLNFVDVCNDC